MSNPRYQVRSFGFAYVVDTQSGNVRVTPAFRTWNEAQHAADDLNAGRREPEPVKVRALDWTDYMVRPI